MPHTLYEQYIIYQYRCIFASDLSSRARTSHSPIHAVYLYFCLFWSTRHFRPIPCLGCLIKLGTGISSELLHFLPFCNCILKVLLLCFFESWRNSLCFVFEEWQLSLFFLSASLTLLILRRRFLLYCCLFLLDW